MLRHLPGMLDWRVVEKTGIGYEVRGEALGVG
jgi:hypothetical protein